VCVCPESKSSRKRVKPKVSKSKAINKRIDERTQKERQKTSSIVSNAGKNEDDGNSLIRLELVRFFRRLKRRSL
jgi:hypothetical protein